MKQDKTRFPGSGRRLRPVLPGILALALALPAAAEPRLSSDWAAFLGEGDSSRVEVFYSVPYGLLNYVQGDTGLEAMFAVRFRVTGPGYEQDATLYRRAAIPSFRAAEEANRTFVDGFSLPAVPGRYQLRVDLLVMETAVTAEEPGLVEMDSSTDSIVVPAFAGRPDLSTLQLASGVIHDTLTGGFSVVPNPARVYGGEGLERVYFYCEGYNLSPAADSYDLAIAVVSARPGRVPADTLVESRQARFKGDRERVSVALGVSVVGLSPGEYRLVVMLVDRVGGSATREAGFLVAGAEEAAPVATHQLRMTQLEAKYHDQLEYIASPRELAYYRALSDSGKQVFLARFWARHNLAEFARRMETARERYRSAGTDGLRTDRGRIYVKYGEPDEVDRRVIEVDRRPREYWKYYANGYTFVFIDITGSDDYRLAWTNSPAEPRTGYESLLTQDEQETFR